jgi:hypothetical protein
MSNAHRSSFATKRRVYRKPRLRLLGDLRTLTLGGSPGLNDSGSSLIRRPLGSLPQPGGYYPPEFYPRPKGAPAPTEKPSDDQP